MESDAPPFTVKAIKTKISVGKERVREMRDEDFEEERAWLLTRDVSEIREVLVAELGSRASGGSGTSLTDPVVLPEEGRLGCERCFSPAPFVCIPHSNHTEPPAHLFTAQHDPMSGRPLVLYRMYSRPRFQSPRRAQFQDCLHGQIRVQATVL